MMMSGRANRFPFTASQWQELEHQALIFKYMVSGIPIPPDLLFTIKRSCLDSPLSSNFFSRQPPHFGWSCFQMGLGRKIDPEPGRCRRTDGKKWRCSKEAYPDSKYCERHMHRGKNRSRKPVEVATQATITNPSTTTAPSKNSYDLLSPPSHSLSFLTSDHQTRHPNHTYHSQHVNHHTYLNPQFLSSNTSSCRPPGIGSSPHDNSIGLILDTGGSCSLANTDYRDRNFYGLKEDVDEHAFFSEHSGSMRSVSGSSLDDTWQLTPLTISSSSSSSPYSSKQRSLSGLQNEYSYLQLQSLSDHDTPKQQNNYQHGGNLLGSDITCLASMKNEREEQKQTTVHRFFDEWPPRNKDSWLDLDDKSSNSASTTTTTRLSISIPSSSSDFPNLNSRTHNDA